MILCLAKISLIIVFTNWTPSKPAITTFHLFIASIVLWALAAVFALSFQCQRPDPWRSVPDRCYNQVKIVEDISTAPLILVCFTGHCILHERSRQYYYGCRDPVGPDHHLMERTNEDRAKNSSFDTFRD